MTHCVPPRLSSVRARAQGVLAQQLAAGGRFMIVDRLGRVLCGSNLGEGLAIAAPAVAGPISTRIIPDRGLVMSMARSEEHTSELQSLMRRSYAVFCLKKQTQKNKHTQEQPT